MLIKYSALVEYKDYLFIYFFRFTIFNVFKKKNILELWIYSCFILLIVFPTANVFYAHMNHHSQQILRFWHFYIFLTWRVISFQKNLYKTKCLLNGIRFLLVEYSLHHLFKINKNVKVKKQNCWFLGLYSVSLHIYKNLAHLAYWSWPWPWSR